MCHLVPCFSKGLVYPASDCLSSRLSHEGEILTCSKLSKQLKLSPSFVPLLGDHCFVPTAKQRWDCDCSMPHVELTVFGLSLPLLFLSPNSMQGQHGFLHPGTPVPCCCEQWTLQGMETVQTKSVWGFHFPLQMSVEMYIVISKHSKGGNYLAALFSVFPWFKSLLASCPCR